MMYNVLYSYNNDDDDFITAHSRATFNLLIFKVLLCIPHKQIYRKNILKALSDPTSTKPNGYSDRLGHSGLADAADPTGTHVLLGLETVFVFSDLSHPVLAS